MRMTTLALAVLVTMTAIAHENTPTKEAPFERYMKRAEDEANKQIERYERNIAGLEGDLKELKGAGRDRQTNQKRRDIAKTLKGAKDGLKQSRQKQEFIKPELRYPLEFGDIGHLPERVVKVTEVISKMEVVVEVEHTSTNVRIRGDGTAGNTSIVNVPSTFRKTLVLKGLDTTGLAEGQKLDLPQAFEITKETGSGRNSVLTLQFVDTSAAEAAWKSKHPPVQPKKPATKKTSE